MDHGEFIWCDLSAHAANGSREFYKHALGWDFVDQGDGYHFATVASVPIAGHYPMPDPFQKIKMPAFWMTYIAVDDVAATTELATSIGAKVEFGPADFASGGTFALIRDPLGAGFTVYSGPPLGSLSNADGHRMGHGLFVSDASKVTEFYIRLFGWSFGTPKDGLMSVTTPQGYRFSVHEIPDPALRGKEEYWGVYFAVGSIEASKAIVRRHGGAQVTDMSLPEGRAALMHDPDGGAFFLVEPSGPARAAPIGSQWPWKAWCGIALMLVLVMTNQLWPWAIFFAFWVFQAVRTGETYLFERIARGATPLTFWVLVIVYMALGLLCLPIWGIE